MTAASNVSTAVNAFATAVYSVNSVFKGYGPANPAASDYIEKALFIAAIK